MRGFRRRKVGQVRHGTSHMTIVDDAGDVVAMTTSVESVFGANIMAGGFMLNNTLTDFFLPAGAGRACRWPMRPTPGKLPLIRHVAHHCVRPRPSLPVVGGLAGRPRHHRLCRPDPLRHPGRQDISLKAAIATPREINQNGATALESGPGADVSLTAGADRHGPYGAGLRPGGQRTAWHHEGERGLYRRRRSPPATASPWGTDRPLY